MISENELRYLTNNFKKNTNLIHFLPKINKCLIAVSGRPVISNCGAPSVVSKYLDYILKPIMRDRWSYIKDSGDFFRTIKNIVKIPMGAILVTTDVVRLYPSISHGVGLEALQKRLNERDSPNTTTGDIVQMTDFVLENKIF